MKPYRLIFALVLLGLCALGQTFTRSLPFLAQSGNSPINLCDARIGDGSPTNQPGYPAYTWWVMQCGISTNGGNTQQYLEDLSSTQLRLTNATGNKVQWLIPHTNQLNGYDAVWESGPALHFVGADAYTNLGQSEYIFVAKATNIVTQGKFFANGLDGVTSDANSKYVAVQSSVIRFVGPSVVDVCSAVGFSNRWMIFDFVFNGANSTIYTNNVQGATVNPGANNPPGIKLFCGSQATDPFRGYCAEVITYRTNLSTAARSNVWWYLKTKYAL